MFELVPRPVPISRQLTSSKVNGKLKDSTADGSVSELKVNFQTSDENKLSSGDVESANILLQNSSASQLNDCNNDKKPTSKNKEIIANPQKALPSEEEKKSLKVSASEAWSVQQQKMLEWALANVPKKSADRWDQIADHVSGKTKVTADIYLPLIHCIVVIVQTCKVAQETVALYLHIIKYVLTLYTLVVRLMSGYYNYIALIKKLHIDNCFSISLY